MREDEHGKKPSNQMIYLFFSTCRTESPVSPCLLLEDNPCYAGLVDLSSESTAFAIGRQMFFLSWKEQALENAAGIFP